MQFARPPDGFKLSISKKVQEAVKQAAKTYPRLDGDWQAICDRIIFTGHRDGTRLREIERELAYVLAFEIPDLPTVQIVYSINVDTLTVHSFRLKDG